MDINKYLEQFPQLEDQCKALFREKYTEVIGQAPMPQIEDYVLTIGIKCDSQRDIIVENFQVLFKAKTEEIVSFLFEQLAPIIRQKALNLLRIEN